MKERHNDIKICPLRLKRCHANHRRPWVKNDNYYIK